MLDPHPPARQHHALATRHACVWPWIVAALIPATTTAAAFAFPAVRQGMVTVAEGWRWVVGGVFAAAVIRQWRTRRLSGPHCTETAQKGRADRGLMFGVLLGATMAWAVVAPVRNFTAPPVDYSMVAGIFGHSDAGDYLRGALHLDAFGQLDAWNCRRPTNACFLLGRMFLGGGDLRLALILQSALAGLSAALLGRTIARTHGTLVGVCVALVPLAGIAAVPALSFTMSETLGLTLACLGGAGLWYGVTEHRLGWALSGLVGLTAALSARPGPMFVLAVLALASGWWFRPPINPRFNAKAAVAAMGVIAAAWGIDPLLRLLYDGQVASGHGNFSVVLYGLATGRPGWEQIYDHFPQAASMSEPELIDLAYRKAAERIRANPLDLALGLARGAASCVGHGLLDLSSWGRSTGASLQVVGRGFLAVVSIVYLITTRNQRSSQLLGAVVVGTALSAPIIFDDGGPRVFAAVLPLLAAVAVLAIGWLARCALASDTSTPSQSQRSAGSTPPETKAAVATIAFVVLLTIAGPACSRARGIGRISHDLPEGVGDGQVVVRLSRSLPFLRVVEPGPETRTFLPTIVTTDLAPHLGNHHQRGFTPFGSDPPRAATLGMVFDANTRTPLILVGPPGLIGDAPQTLLVQGTLRASGEYFFFDAMASRKIDD